jgi:hypothetical protein
VCLEGLESAAAAVLLPVAPAESGKLVLAEDRAMGDVPWSVYYR